MYKRELTIVDLDAVLEDWEEFSLHEDLCATGAALTDAFLGEPGTPARRRIMLAGRIERGTLRVEMWISGAMPDTCRVANEPLQDPHNSQCVRVAFDACLARIRAEITADAE